MNLLDATRKLVHKDTTEIEWLAACKAFEEALARCGDPQEIRAAIHLDSAYKLPIDLSQAAYQKLIVLGDYTADVFRGYAARLLMFERAAVVHAWELGREIVSPD